MMKNLFSGAGLARALFLLVSTLGLASPAFADSGDTAWILTSTALVLFMTLPLSLIHI